MAYFFAYGCELNRPHVLARSVAGATDNAIGVNGFREAKQDDSATAAKDAALNASVGAPACVAAVLEASLKQRFPDNSLSGLRDYSLSEPIATGYIRDKALVYRRRQDEHAEPLIDIDISPGQKLWGLLFDLTEETINTLCQEFDLERKCKMQTVVVNTLLPSNIIKEDAWSFAAGEVVEATVLQAVCPTHSPANPVKSLVYRLLPTYLAYNAPMYAIRAILGYRASLVDMIRVNARDSAERPIEEVYYKSVPNFAIYRTSERVTVQYADDARLATAQQSSMASINSLRSQIDGLLDGWKKSDCDGDRTSANRFNARVAAALNQLLLENDHESAKFTLEGVRDDIVAMRTSRGRFQYVTGALSTAVTLCIAFWLAKSMYGAYDPTTGIWLAARAGAVGALFSIAMNIRERTVQLDLNGRDNYADAALRVFVGAIGAGALTCLLQSGVLPPAKFGDSALTGGKMTWEVLLTLGFAAGFSERLVTTMFDRFGSSTQSNATVKRFYRTRHVGAHTQAGR